MSKRSIAKEISGLIVTGARYGIAERIARKVRDDEPVTANLAGFVAADIADGAILRKFDADTPLRRVADGVVDHLSIARVSYEAAKKHPASRFISVFLPFARHSWEVRMHCILQKQAR